VVVHAVVVRFEEKLTNFYRPLRLRGA